MPHTAPIKTASWTYAEDFVAEDEILAAARSRAEEVGVSPIGSGTGAALRFLASVLDARAVVEIGTGTGVSGAALLGGMATGGVLTSIDVEAEHQRVARETFTALGYDHTRARLIAGRALEVLPRLSDAAYDMVVVDGDKAEYPAVLAQAKRLLRDGGMVVLDNVLWGGRVVDPAERDAETAALRETIAAVKADDEWTPSLLSVGDGLLVAALDRAE